MKNFATISDVVLQSLNVQIQNGCNRMVIIQAVYDSDAMKFYNCADVAESIIYKCIIKQSLFGGVDTSERVNKNHLNEFRDTDGKYKCKLDVLSQKRIRSEIRKNQFGPR